MLPPLRMMSLVPVRFSPEAIAGAEATALEIFKSAFEDREFWISETPATALIPGKKPPLSAANLGAIISDVGRALLVTHFPVAVKARQQLVNIERLIRRLHAANHVGFVVFDNISYKGGDFSFHYVLYGEIRSDGGFQHPMNG